MTLTKMNQWSMIYLQTYHVLSVSPTWKFTTNLKSNYGFIERDSKGDWF